MDLNKIDKIIMGSGDANSGYVDASREEILEQLRAPNPDQQPQQPQGAVPQQAAPQVQAPKPQAQPQQDNPLGGIGKWVEENINIPIVDMLDTSRNAEQVAADRAKLRKDQAAKDQEIRREGGNEVGRVAGGAILGALETVGSAAELIGDTSKTARQATGVLFGTIKNIDPTQNPFDNRYEWAKWDLGKDEVGAKTGVGKVAQGFLEFGILMAGTGGFGGMTGAGAKVAGATGALAKGKVIAQAGLQGGLAGLAADMISASKGDGNLSNLIKENAPEWYPAFLTALAVDEDDNPWEAVLKTGLEGLTMGIAADAVGAYIGGARAARKALKAGKSEQQAAEIALKKSQELLDAKPKQPTLTEAYGSREKVAEYTRTTREALARGMEYGMDVQDAAFTDKLSRLWDEAEKGIPPTWDDVADTVPDLFEPGGRVMQPDFHPEVYSRLEAPGDGFTINPFTGEVPTSGTAVAIVGESLDDFSQEAVENFIAKNYDILSREDVYLGGWVSDITGKPVIEISHVLKDGRRAEVLGKLFDQEGVFRLDDFEYIPTNGADMLKKTKLDNLASPFDKTVTSTKTVSSTEAVAQQLAAKSSPTPVRASSYSPITEAQLEKIAKAVGDAPAQQLRKIAENNPVDLSELSKLSRKPVAEIVKDAQNYMADILGVTGDVDFNKIPKMKVGDDTLLTREGIVAVRGLMQDLSTRLYTTAESIARTTDSGIDATKQVERLTRDLKALLRVHKESANAYSNMLHTYKLKVPGLGIEIDNPFRPPSAEQLGLQLKEADKVLDEMVEKVRIGEPGAMNEALRVATAVRLAGGDASKIVKLSANLRGIALNQALKIMYNSMLSGPATHIVNAMSNAMNTIYRPATMALGGDAKMKKAAIAGFYGFNETLKDAFEMASRSLFTDVPETGGKTMAMASEIDEQLKMLRKTAESSTDRGFKAAVGVVDVMKALADFPAFAWPSRLLASSDDFFKTMVARMDMQQRAMLSAIEEADSLGKPIQEVYENLLKNDLHYQLHKATGEVTSELAEKAAKEATFQTELEGWAASFAQFVNNVPIMRPFFPFVKVGHNIMVYAGSHVPLLNQALPEVRRALNGDDAVAAAAMRGRIAFGRALVMAGGLAAYTGLITGNGPSDPQRKKEWEQNFQPRSIKIGEEIDPKTGKKKTIWLDYSRIEPFGQILSALADIHYALNSGEMEESRADYLTGYLTYAIAANLTNKSYMQGLVPLGKILQPGWQGIDQLKNFGPEVLNNFFPMAGARRTFTNLITPYMQEFDSQSDRLAYNATLGIVNKGAIKYDWLDGEPLRSPFGGHQALLPLRTGERNTDIVRDKLEDIEYDSATVIKLYQGVELKPEHISRLQQLMGKSGLHDALKRVVNLKGFDEAVEQYKSDRRAGVTRADKRTQPFYRMIDDTVMNYRDLAMEQLKQEFPELALEALGNRLLKKAERSGQAVQGLIDMPN